MPGEEVPDPPPAHFEGKERTQQPRQKNLQEITTGGGVNVSVGIIKAQDDKRDNQSDRQQNVPNRDQLKSSTFSVLRVCNALMKTVHFMPVLQQHNTIIYITDSTHKVFYRFLRLREFVFDCLTR